MKRTPRFSRERRGMLSRGYLDLLSNLRDETIALGKPVVLVHGDSHYFMVDKPLLDASGRRARPPSRG
jgi:hypothetical protein